MPSVIVNGVQHSGTHALQKCCWLLGLDAQHGHWTTFDKLPDHTHHLYIKRDPRNVICSSIRADGRPVTSGMFAAYLSGANEYRFPSVFDEMVGWLSSPSCYVVTYESLVADDTTLRGIAGHLGVPYLEDAWPNLPGATLTWKPQHVDWRSIWNDVVEERWVAAGGPRLLKEWGYV